MKRTSNLLAGAILMASLSFTSAAYAENGTTERVAPAAAAANDESSNATAASSDGTVPCRWWQFGRCEDNQVQVVGLPDGAPREGTIVTVDLSTHTVYLFRDGEMLAKSLAGTGSDKKLTKGKKTWWFRTPRGVHKVLRKIPDPVWRKPDWAFIEEGKSVPPADSPKRLVKGKLGKYALDLGDGYLLHGTDDPNSFGRKVSHGCIRLPDHMLETLWKEVAVGTQVFIYESEAPAQTASKGMNDLDM